VGWVRVHQGETHLDITHPSGVIKYAKYERLPVDTVEEDAYYTIAVACGFDQHTIFPDLDVGVGP